MTSKLRTYSNDAISVSYDVKRCIHAAECVRGSPQVFDPQRKPWIDLTDADPDEVARTVLRCPTGALQFTRTDGEQSEQIPATATVKVDRDGPLYLHGEFKVMRSDGTVVVEDARIALCRCGASKNKPFCDNSHVETGFQAE